MAQGAQQVGTNTGGNGVPSLASSGHGFFVEIIFNWPGLGLYTVRSLLNLDYPAIMGITLFGAFMYVIINLIVDLLQAWVDPRISLQ